MRNPILVGAAAAATAVLLATGAGVAYAQTVTGPDTAACAEAKTAHQDGIDAKTALDAAITAGIAEYADLAAGNPRLGSLTADDFTTERLAELVTRGGDATDPFQDVAAMKSQFVGPVVEGELAAFLAFDLDALAAAEVEACAGPVSPTPEPTADPTTGPTSGPADVPAGDDDFSQVGGADVPAGGVATGYRPLDA